MKIVFTMFSPYVELWKGGSLVKFWEDFMWENAWFMSLYAYSATFTLISLRYRYGQTVNWDTSYISLQCTCWWVWGIPGGSRILSCFYFLVFITCIASSYLCELLYVCYDCLVLECFIPSHDLVFFPLFLVVDYRNLEPFHCNV